MATNSLFVEYVESSSTARRLLWHLYSVTSVRYRTHVTAEPYMKPGAAVLWTESGHGMMKLNGVPIKLEPGPFYLYSTRATREYIPPEGKTFLNKAFWFSGPGLESWLEELDTSNQPQFYVKDPKAIHRAFQKMLNLTRKRPPLWELKVHYEISSILDQFLLARGGLAPRANSLPAAIATALNAVEADPMRDWNAAQMAQVAGMGHSAFRVLFRKAMNESPHSYLLGVRLELAREMLADPKMLIKEIAAKLHFSSKNYFSSFFHQHTGTTPMAFRRLSLKSSQA